jgi:hypothetical protein
MNRVGATAHANVLKADSNAVSEAFAELAR